MYPDRIVICTHNSGMSFTWLERYGSKPLLLTTNSPDHRHLAAALDQSIPVDLPIIQIRGMSRNFLS